MARICYGEFDYPEYRPEDRIPGRTGRTAYLQGEFLKAIHKHAPQVLEDLYDLRELALTLDAAWLTWPYIRRKRVDKELRKSVEDLAAALEQWARSWNVDEEWCLQRAYDALRWWTRHGKLDSVLWAGASWGGADNKPKPPPPPNGVSEYRPLFERRDTYLESIRSNDAPHGLLKLAKTYCAEVERSYECAGYVRCKASEKRQLDRHLEWAVRFQVCGESLKDIATSTSNIAEGGIDESTVLRGVYNLLSMIYLDKRADAKRGRRRGSKSKESSAMRKTRRELAR